MDVSSFNPALNQVRTWSRKILLSYFCSLHQKNRWIDTYDEFSFQIGQIRTHGYPEKLKSFSKNQSDDRDSIRKAVESYVTKNMKWILWLLFHPDWEIFCCNTFFNRRRFEPLTNWQEMEKKCLKVIWRIISEFWVVGIKLVTVMFGAKKDSSVYKIFASYIKF